MTTLSRTQAATPRQPAHRELHRLAAAALAVLLLLIPVLSAS